MSSDPSKLTRSRRLAGTSGVTLACRIGAVAIGIGLTPFCVDHLGLATYGIWAIVSNLTNYINLLAPGLSNVVIRYVARSYATGERRTAVRIVGFGVVGWILLGLIFSPLAVIGLPFLASQFQAAHHVTSVAGTVLILGYVQFFASQAETVLAGQLVGAGDLWIANVIDFASRVVYAILTIVLLLDGHGIYGLILATFVALGVQVILVAIFSKIRLGSIVGNPFALPRPLIKEMLSFGGWIQLGGVASLFVLGTDQMVIASALSVTDVALVNLAGSLAAQVSFLPNSLLGTLVPAAAALHVRGDHERLKRLSVTGGRMFNLLGIGLGGLLVGVAPVAYRVWLGRSYPLLGMVMLFQVSIMLVDSIIDVPALVLQGMGKPKVQATNSLYGGVTNIVLTVALIFPFGLTGVLAATLGGVIVRTCMFMRRFHRELQLGWWMGLLAWLLPLTAAAVIAAGATRLVLLAVPSAWWHGRAGGLLVLAGLTVIFAVVFVLALRALHFVSRTELQEVTDALPGRISRTIRAHPDSLLIRVLAYDDPHANSSPPPGTGPPAPGDLLPWPRRTTTKIKRAWPN